MAPAMAKAIGVPGEVVLAFSPGGLPLRAVRIAAAAPKLGRKLDFLLGLATGARNVQRSRAMASELGRIGLHDSPATREMLADHFAKVLNDPTNILEIQANGRVVRESLLMGPGGAVKVRSIWQDDHLITTILEAPKRK